MAHFDTLTPGLTPVYPDALQTWIWESGLRVNETCFVQADKSSRCHQGRIPFYSVTVEAVEEIRRSVLFAQRFNLRLIIHNTGHDLAGRSSGADSLQIHTHRLQDVAFHQDFIPSGSNVPMGRAVTVGAGVVMGDLYRRCAIEGVTVVGGDCPTVGVLGGYLQGGGVSPFFALEAGLAVDNALEFEVVTANVGRVTPSQLLIMLNESIRAPLWLLTNGGIKTCSGLFVEAGEARLVLLCEPRCALLAMCLP